MWQRVLDRAAAIRLLETIDLGRWSAIYEVDSMDFGVTEITATRTTKQYLVAE